MSRAPLPAHRLTANLTVHNCGILFPNWATFSLIRAPYRLSVEHTSRALPNRELVKCNLIGQTQFNSTGQT